MPDDDTNIKRKKYFLKLLKHLGKGKKVRLEVNKIIFFKEAKYRSQTVKKKKQIKQIMISDARYRSSEIFTELLS